MWSEDLERNANEVDAALGKAEAAGERNAIDRIDGRAGDAAGGREGDPLGFQDFERIGASVFRLSYAGNETLLESCGAIGPGKEHADAANQHAVAIERNAAR